MENEARRRVVARVALLEGGIERFAVLMGVSSGLVTRWIEGLAPIPADAFLRCVDYLMDHTLPMGDVRQSAADESKPGPA